jgi:hypothetical protein
LDNFFVPLPESAAATQSEPSIAFLGFLILAIAVQLVWNGVADSAAERLD